MNKKFEYYLNAIHYCIYLGEVRSTKRMEKGVSRLFSIVLRLFFTERFRNKFYDRRLRHREELNEYMYGKNYGQSISVAHHWFGYFYSGYACYFSFVLASLHFRLTEDESFIINGLLVFIPITIAYIPAYRAVFTNDRYLKYFRQFEKEDEQWHKKWKRRTIAFCVGSVMTILMGIATAWIIVFS